MAEKKKKKWILPRHRVITAVLRYPVGWYCRLRYGLRYPKHKDLIRQQSLILLNHQTPFDQFFVGLYFKDPVYYMATEDIFSNGWVSKLIKFAVAPIPIKKQTTDASAVMTCLRVAREGATIALAPEGNRTYSGRLAYIKPSIVGLVRLLRLPVVLYHIEGGYGVHPRWSDVVRKGRMHCFVSEVIEPEEYKKLSDEELLERIRKGLDVDETKIEDEYHHKKLAEYLERAMYVCPFCGLSEFESHDDVIACKKCGRQIRYLPNKQLEGIGFEFPYRFVADWYDYQQSFVGTVDLSQYMEEPLYCENVTLYDVKLYDRKRVIWKTCELSIFGDRLEIAAEAERMVLPFSDISVMTVLGKNKLEIYFGEKVYQLKGDARFNALKYVNLYFHERNTRKGEENGEFLGL